MIRSANTRRRVQLKKARSRVLFSYILSEQNAYIHIKNLGKNREQLNIGVACAAFPFGNRLCRKVQPCC